MRFRKFRGYEHEGWARKRLERRQWRASHSRIEPMKEFDRLVRDHKDGILACTRSRISNGALEGMNNKIKSLCRRSRGFRTDRCFLTAVYLNCGGLPIDEALNFALRSVQQLETSQNNFHFEEPFRVAVKGKTNEITVYQLRLSDRLV
ncbi:MAG: transposase [bacterium]